MVVVTVAVASCINMTCKRNTKKKQLKTGIEVIIETRRMEGRLGGHGVETPTHIKGHEDILVVSVHGKANEVDQHPKGRNHRLSELLLEGRMVQYSAYMQTGAQAATLPSLTIYT